MTIKRSEYALRSDRGSSTEDDDVIPPAQPQHVESDSNPTSDSPRQSPPTSPGQRKKPAGRSTADNIILALERITERLDRMDEERRQDRRERATERNRRDTRSPLPRHRSRPDERRHERTDSGRRAVSAFPEARAVESLDGRDRHPARGRTDDDRARRRNRSPSRQSPVRRPAPGRRSRSPESPDNHQRAYGRDRSTRSRRRSPASPSLRHTSPESLVRALLSTTKKGLKHKRGVHPDYIYPFELIERGTEKKGIKRGEATYEEYAVALRFMENQPAFHPDDLPALREHSLQVAEDAKVLPWSFVREWSEEVFDKIADGRLPSGWRDPMALANARFGQLQIASIQRKQRQDPGHGRGSGASQAPAFDREDRNMGKPCGPWNRNESACDKANRGKYHTEDGLRYSHICAYCAYKLGRVLPHSEVNCANKKRNSAKPDTERKGF